MGQPSERRRENDASVGTVLGPTGGVHKVRMMQGHEEFEVETDRAEELPMPFWSETVRRVVVG